MDGGLFESVSARGCSDVDICKDESLTGISMALADWAKGVSATGSRELWVVAGTCESRFLSTEVLAICGVNGGSSATVLICCGLSVVPDAAMSLSGETSS